MSIARATHERAAAQQQPIPGYDAHEPSEASKRVTAIFDDMESKQLDNLNDVGKSLIERIATFLSACCSASRS